MNCRSLISICLNSLDDDNDIGDELLDILIKFSPKSLIDVSISANWKYSIEAFERFFESYRERKLREFVINDYIGEHITIEHLGIVKKYHKERIILCSNLLTGSTR
jgi:hypothetical protein